MFRRPATALPNLAELWDYHPDRGDTGIVAEGARVAAAAIVPEGDSAARREALPAPDGWRQWLHALFPAYVSRPFADRHVEFWEWVWAIELGLRPRPFVGVWPRGGAKSTGAELATVALGSRGKRRYALYVRDTQDNADNSVGNIAALLEQNSIARHYPAHAQRMLSKYGSSKGWRRNRLRTAGGYTVDAVGLDTAARGLKVEDQRPDVIIFDDIDGKHDSPAATKKKIEIITRTILQTGTAATAVIFIQNLIIPNGVCSQLSDGRADFLIDRIVSGPFKAVEGLKTESYFDTELQRIRARIIAGRATWEGQSLEDCQQFIDTFGLQAFIEECQQEVHERQGALWKRSQFKRVDQAPRMKRIVVAVDPSGGGDEIGIGAAGLGYDGRAYILRDVSQPGALGPLNWGNATVDLYDDLKADKIVGEKNFGGDMVESNIRVAAGLQRRVNYADVWASRGKTVRAEPVAALFGSEDAAWQDTQVLMVGQFPELETELTTYVPGDPRSPNRLDWMVWALTELMLTDTAAPRFSVVGA